MFKHMQANTLLSPFKKNCKSLTELLTCFQGSSLKTSAGHAHLSKTMGNAGTSVTIKTLIGCLRWIKQTPWEHQDMLGMHWYQHPGFDLIIS